MKKLSLVISATLLCLGLLSNLLAEEKVKNQNAYDAKSGKFVVHEWGVWDTGNSYNDDELPSYINRSEYVELAKGFPNPVQNDGAVHRRDWGMRKEKPVIYFYSPEKKTLDCGVTFAKSMPLVWFPKAELTTDVEAELALLGKWAADFYNYYVNGNEREKERDIKDREDSRRKPANEGIGRWVIDKNGISIFMAPPKEMTELYNKTLARIDELQNQIRNGEQKKNALLWKGVTLQPDAVWKFQHADEDHWISLARDLDACPLIVGTEKEKFLFYEGLDHLKPEIELLADGDDVLLRNSGEYDALDAFYVRIYKGNFQIIDLGDVKAGEKAQSVKPGENTKVLKNIKEANQYLIEKFEKAGLYTREAEQVTKIWRKRFFQTEGSRVIYRWDPKRYDEEFPLTLSEKPDEIKRVMLVVVENKAEKE